MDVRQVDSQLNGFGLHSQGLPVRRFTRSPVLVAITGRYCKNHAACCENYIQPWDLETGCQTNDKGYHREARNVEVSFRKERCAHPFEVKDRREHKHEAGEPE